MAVLISPFTSIINLPMVYRDFGWDAATCLDNVTDYSLSAMDSRSKKFRRNEIYGDHRTNSDGYVLVFEHENYEMKSVFEDLLLEYGFEKHFHFATSSSVWCDLLEINVSGSHGNFVLQAAKHGHDPRLELHLSSSQKKNYTSVKLDSVVVNQLVLSKDYIDYQLLGVFKKSALLVRSLFESRFTHLDRFAPLPYTRRGSLINRLDLSAQVLPGIENVVPTIELVEAEQFKMTPEYFTES